MIEENKIPAVANRAVVTTAWGEVNRNAIFVEGTGQFYFQLASGNWLNYEPDVIARAEVLAKLL